ncbi:MAG: electron transfer flavoprotein subunit alpha/FixB family protein [Bryobacterales bacterium]|nr:electron transfer flavoprotein subunit alpha/FixB family protein [Bryobacterales bacterium]MBV9398853.1 electron transfer flavoprotein subunit alpha/FixB family protein [Bryobacterales bacterium]
MSVLAVLEQQGGKWHRMSWETFAAAQEIAAALGTEVEAAVAGSGVAAIAPEAAAKQAARVWAVEHPLLNDYTADGYAAAFEALIRRANPALVLFPHTYQTRDFAPKLATRFGCVLISDAVAARVEDGGPVFVRQLFQGKLNADVRPRGSGPHFASLQAGAWRADNLQSGSAPVETFEPPLQPSQIRQKPEPPFRESARGVDLSAANIIVSVGRGIGDKDKIPIVEQLAQAIGGELAASRPICDAGWLPMERQVGSSGQTVSPKVYVAVGISGAIQHLVGMKGSKTIVAINRDKDAPIFEVADYGIVGDLFEVVPALVQELGKSKS